MKGISYLPKFLSSIIISALLITSCGGGAKKNFNIPKVRKPVYVPGVSPPPPEYRIGFGDVLDVKFFYDPELNETLLVRSDGRVTLPRLGDLVVVGMTPSQLDSIVTIRYSEILKNPDITIQVRKSAEEVVYVLGEVNKPGVYTTIGRMSILQAIAAAGGFSHSAKTSSIVVFHSNGMEKPTAQRVNLSKVLGRENLDENILLSGYDIVYVPKTFIGKLDLFVDQFFTKVFPPLFETYIKGYDAYRIQDRYNYYSRFNNQ